MFSQFFGHYLLNRGYISSTQLVTALEYQKSVYVKFGVIAVDKGYMTSSQVEEVHDKQKHLDKRFGEIAVDLGYLTNEQVESLISHQKQGYLFLAQALVDLGSISMDQFSKALHDYKRENSLTDEQFEAIRNGNIETLIDTIFREYPEENLKYRQYLTLFTNNMIRFIDDQVYLEISDVENVQQGDWVVHQVINGTAPLYTAISGNTETFVHIASVYAQEELTSMDELAKDAVCEFLNLHNGIYLVNMSNWGTELSMNPQKMEKDVTITGQLFPITVKTLKGSFQLVLSDQPNTVATHQVSQTV